MWMINMSVGFFLGFATGYFLIKSGRMLERQQFIPSLMYAVTGAVLCGIISVAPLFLLRM